MCIALRLEAALDVHRDLIIPGLGWRECSWRLLRAIAGAGLACRILWLLLVHRMLCSGMSLSGFTLQPVDTSTAGHDREKRGLRACSRRCYTRSSLGWSLIVQLHGQTSTHAAHTCLDAVACTRALSAAGVQIAWLAPCSSRAPWMIGRWKLEHPLPHAMPLMRQGRCFH